jgi:hypothetical protein
MACERCAGSALPADRLDRAGATEVGHGALFMGIEQFQLGKVRKRGTFHLAPMMANATWDRLSKVLPFLGQAIRHDDDPTGFPIPFPNKNVPRRRSKAFSVELNQPL